jgi:hypothetical protein
MTDKQIKHALHDYLNHISTIIDAGTENKEELTHLQYMISKINGLLKEGKREKAFRWLGFIQGVLWSQKYIL